MNLSAARGGRHAAGGHVHQRCCDGLLLSAVLLLRWSDQLISLRKPVVRIFSGLAEQYKSSMFPASQALAPAPGLTALG